MKTVKIAAGTSLNPSYVIAILDVAEQKFVEREGKRIPLRTGRKICHVVVNELMAEENGMGGMAAQTVFYLSDYDYETTRKLLHGELYDDDYEVLSSKVIPPLDPNWANQQKKPDIIIP